MYIILIYAWLETMCDTHRQETKMAIKMLKVSFDLPIEVLLKAVTEHNVGLNIQAYQQAVEPRDSFEAIENKSEGTLREVILAHLKHSGQAIHISELREITTQHGSSLKSLSNLLYVLFSHKLISRPAPRTYRITKRGIEY
jgi:hypothetical protein